VEKHQGEFPISFEDVLALPGVGRYTAGAICSVAFNHPTAILDGNVTRVLTRLFGIRENTREKEINQRLWSLASELVQATPPTALSSQRRAGMRARGDQQQTILFEISGARSAINQSLMELGATVCIPKQPKCDTCPVAKFCAARRENVIDQIPNLGERVATTARRFVACVVERRGAILVRQRPEGVVNAHLWEFPNIEVRLKTSRAKTQAQLESELGCAFRALVPLITVKHTITRYRMTLEAFRGELSGTPCDMPGQWIAQGEVERLAFTSAHRRVFAASRQQSRHAG
jgi:A/G-specific adenine glycosylase